MPYKIIPLTPNANQNFICTLPVDGKNLTLGFNLKYNVMGNYWFMSISDHKSKALLLDGIPLVTGEFPAANLLEQYSYLNIGSAVVLPVSAVSKGIPDDTNLGTEYVLVWGDTSVD